MIERVVIGSKSSPSRLAAQSFTLSVSVARLGFRQLGGSHPSSSTITIATVTSIVAGQRQSIAAVATAISISPLVHPLRCLLAGAHLVRAIVDACPSSGGDLSTASELTPDDSRMDKLARRTTSVMTGLDLSPPDGWVMGCLGGCATLYQPIQTAIRSADT